MMRYFVLAQLCTIAVIAYIQRLGLQSASAPIQADMEINTEQFAALGTAWLLGYSVLQIPTGWLADRFGSRNILVLLAILWSSIAACVGLCRDFPSLLALWFAMGMALGGIFPCSAKAIGAWFPDTERGSAAGLLGSSTVLGAALAYWLTSQLLGNYHWTWQSIYLLYGLVGILWAVCFFLLVPERHVGNKPIAPMRPADWRTLLTSASVWYLCGQQFFRAGAMIFFLNWFQKFLQEARALPLIEAGEFARNVNLSALAGGLLGGFFSDWMLRRTGNRRMSRQGVAVVGMTLAGVCVMATYWIESASLALVLFCLAAFLASFGGVAGYTVAIELGGARIGIVFSLMNTCGNIGAALVNQLVGTLKERTGTWNSALVAITLICLIDAIFWALLNPQRPLFEEPSDAR